jgi:hypothetical protein
MFEERRPALKHIQAYLVDDHEVARKHALQQRHGPALQRLGQDGVVGVGEGVAADLPRLVPLHVLLLANEAKKKTVSPPIFFLIFFLYFFPLAWSRKMRISSGMASDGCVSLSWMATLCAKTSKDVRSTLPGSLTWMPTCRPCMPSRFMRMRMR